MTERKNTGTYVSQDECEKVIQLFGIYHDSTDSEGKRANKHILNDYLSQLSKKYKMKNPWFEYEIAPTGEFIHVTRDAEDAEKFRQEFGEVK